MWVGWLVCVCVCVFVCVFWSVCGCVCVGIYFFRFVVAKCDEICSVLQNLIINITKKWRYLRMGSYALTQSFANNCYNQSKLLKV